MGGWSAPDDINAAIDTYVLLAEGSGTAEGKTGGFWYQTRARTSKGSGRETNYERSLDDEARQQKLIETLARISGVNPPQ